MRVAVLAAALTALITLGGCFDEPIREELTLELSADDRVTLTLETHLAKLTQEESTPELRARLAEERRKLASGEDDWTARFDSAEALTDSVTHARTAGVLTAVRRQAEIDLIKDPEALRRFFADTLVAVTWRTTTAERELFLEPLAPGRASYRDRQRLNRRLASWTAAVADYFTAAGELYEYLERYPERRRPVFAVVLDDAVIEADRADEEILADAEKPLVEALSDAMAAVLEVLTLEPGEAFSLNEISRLVYDPFPARVRILLPATATAVEGFVPGDSPREWKVPEISLWSALAALAAPRLSPDPLALLVASEAGLLGRSEPAPPFALDSVALGELRYPLDPDADELRREVEGRLAAQPVYRLSWR